MAVKLVLVDDHQILRDGIRLLVETLQEGYEIVAEAEDGRTAVRAVADHRPDIVIMDISMPDLNGIDACAQIKASWPSARVIALSMHDSPRMVADMLSAGASAYLLKQNAFDELARALRVVRAGQVYLSPAIARHVVDLAAGRATLPERTARNVLTPREREVVQLIAEGRSTKEVAARLSVSPKTIESHRKQIMDKLGFHSIAQLTKYALREGLTDPNCG